MPKSFGSYSVVGKISLGVRQDGFEGGIHALCQHLLLQSASKVEVQRLCSRPPQALGMILSKTGAEQRVRLVHLVTAKTPTTGGQTRI
jgi:hypothetical protein